jgi:Predicted membrane protein (DUF2232)
VQPLIAWLVARPQNAVIALVATLLLPLLKVVSGIIMVLLVLRQGVVRAALEGLVAGVLLATVAAVAGGPVAQVATAMATTWLPAVALAAMLQFTRSLTLTLQVAVLLAGSATAVLHAAVADPVAWWQPVMDQLLDWARQNNLQQQADLMESEPVMTANMMTMAMVLSSWSLYAVYLLFGYGASATLPGTSRNFGRFRDLNFGRVIALMTAVLATLAAATGAAWLQGTAFVLFAVFWLQGLAVVHWMYAAGAVPLFVVILTYVLMPVLHVFLMLALAMLGYTDAWFRFRRRAAKQI